jgi:hypothetical protein
MAENLLGQDKQELLFLKKKKQKNVFSCGLWRPPGQGPQDQKFFGSFFQKRTASLLC